MIGKPWYQSHALWASAILLIVGLIQVIATARAEGLAAVDWTAWAQTAAGLIVGVVRVINGTRDASPSPRLTGGGSAGVGAALALGVLLLTGSCAHTPEERAAAASWTQATQSVLCSVARQIVGAIPGLGEDVLPWLDLGCELGERLTLAVVPYAATERQLFPNGKRLGAGLFCEASSAARTVEVSCDGLQAACATDDLAVLAACEGMVGVLSRCREGRATAVDVGPEG